MRVGMALLFVCLASLVVAGVVLAAPEVSPAWSVGSLALLTAVLVVAHCRRNDPIIEEPARERVVFQKLVRVKGTGNQDEPGQSHGQHEILLRIVDVRGLRLENTTPHSNPQAFDPRRSRTV